VKVGKSPTQISAIDMGKLKILLILETSWHIDHVDQEDRMINRHGREQSGIFTPVELELG
jgi:hypothetical protein